jgi:hypothetical protein
MKRSIPQNRKFHALVRDIAARVLLVPWNRAIAQEAWKRFFIKIYVHETRMEAYANGQEDPFPVRPVPSHQLDAQQMDSLIECTLAVAAQSLGLIIEEPQQQTKEQPHESK